MSDLGIYHGRTRERGANTLLCWALRTVLHSFFRLYFRLRRDGRDHIPAAGPVILASNHRSFLDPFVIACCLRRPIYFFAKRELFERRWLAGLLNALGAFPVRRGESDEEAIETARLVLERGDAVLIFPEGTRVRRGSLAAPRRGVGRLALATGAPVVPIAVCGSERARRGWRIRPCRVRVRCGRPLTFPRVKSLSPRLATEVAARIWPCVALQWEWLGGLPPLRKAAVVGAGPMGTAIATLLARAGLDVELGCRAAARLDGMPELPGVTVSPVAEIEFAAVDLVVFAVPSRNLPAAVAQVGDRVGGRSAVLVVSKGLVAPLGTLPSRYVAERVRVRAVAALGGPAHAAEAVERGASVVVATDDRDFGDQLATALRHARLDVELTGDVAGVELAGCAKNVSALAAGAAAASGMNAAGAAAGRLFADVHQLALARGARSETFVGLAGAGDLVATAMAGHSRNRRAGELLAAGVPADQIAGALGAAAEALDTVALLATALEREGLDARATGALAALIDGRLTALEWVSSVRASSASAGRRAA